MVLSHLLLLCVAAPPPAAANVGQGSPSRAELDMIQAVFKLADEGRTLAAVAALERGAKDDERGMAAEMLGTYLSFVGDHEGAMRAFDGPPRASESTAVPASVPEIDGARAQDAIRAIVRESRGRRIVILNEAHHVPRGRAFALLLARALRKEGFDRFAAEAFSLKAPDAYAARAPRRDTGFYTKEPFFGDLVRETMRLGYEPIVYEAESLTSEGTAWDRIASREGQQAQNLYERWFRRHPRSRLLVYCGYSHATEDWAKGEDGRERGWMAARLARLTGLDPLTIDQTAQIPHSRLGAETSAFRYAQAKGLLAGGPKVFRKADGRYAVLGDDWRGRVDMQVFSPREGTVAGRPGWARVDGHRRPVAVPAAAIPASGRALVQAFTTDPRDEVPVDQAIVSGGRPATLMLPRGRYRVVAQDEAGDSKPVGEVRAG